MTMAPEPAPDSSRRGRRLAQEAEANASSAPTSPHARRTRIALLVIVFSLLAATVVGLAALWPRGELTGPSVGSQQVDGKNAQILVGTVVTVDLEASQATVSIDGAADPGSDVPVQLNPEAAGIMKPGDQIKVMFIPAAMGSGSPYVFVDFVRDAPIIWLAAAYALLVVAVARWRGFASIVGLALSFGLVFVFILPALLRGGPPIPIALVGAASVMFVVLYLAHGINLRTTSALLGTFAGLGVTAALAWWSVDSTRLTGFSEDVSYWLPSYAPELSLQGVLMCGIILAGLGVLNDVTITQASAIWELKSANPAAGRWVLFRSAMRIGRDHIASTVYTIAFAYVGAALPLILYLSLQDQGLFDAVTSWQLAEEVVHTLVTSIGLVLAIPLTTLIATFAVDARRSGDVGHGHSHGHAAELLIEIPPST